MVAPSPKRDFKKFPENLGDSHGSPRDRGSADAYYGRPKIPHYYPNGTYNDPLITELTIAETTAYLEGYESCSDRKD